MAVLLSLTAAAALLGVGVYLAVLLGLVRKRGFGTGQTVEVPGSNLCLRVPDWWSVERPASGDHCEHSDDGADGAGGCAREASSVARSGSGAAAPAVRIRTGNHRGILEIRIFSQAAFPEESPAPPSRAPSWPPDLATALEGILAARGFVLDQSAVRTLAPDPAAVSPGPPAAWIASNGRRASSDESRSYFELHLLAPPGRFVLLEYSNSVLYGYLDAFYIQRVLDTIRALETPPAR